MSTPTRIVRREALLLLIGAVVGGVIIACFMAARSTGLVPSRPAGADAAAVETATRESESPSEADLSADETLAAVRKEEEPQVSDAPRDPEAVEVSKEVLRRAQLYANGLDLHKMTDAELKAAIEAAIDETKVEYDDAVAQYMRALNRSLGRAVDEGKGETVPGPNDPPRVATSPPRESDDGQIHALVPNRDGVVMEVTIPLDAELAVKDTMAVVSGIKARRVEAVALVIARHEKKKNAAKSAGQ
jgi:hypothetical protein